jgi:hypothetical protein
MNIYPDVHIPVIAIKVTDITISTAILPSCKKHTE